MRKIIIFYFITACGFNALAQDQNGSCQFYDLENQTYNAQLIESHTFGTFEKYTLEDYNLVINYGPYSEGGGISLYVSVYKLDSQLFKSITMLQESLPTAMFEIENDSRKFRINCELPRL